MMAILRSASQFNRENISILALTKMRLEERIKELRKTNMSFEVNKVTKSMIKVRIGCIDNLIQVRELLEPIMKLYSLCDESEYDPITIGHLSTLTRTKVRAMTDDWVDSLRRTIMNSEWTFNKGIADYLWTVDYVDEIRCSQILNEIVDNDTLKEVYCSVEIESQMET